MVGDEAGDLASGTGRGFVVDVRAREPADVVDQAVGRQFWESARVDLATLRVELACHDAFAAKAMECMVEAANSREEIDESKAMHGLEFVRGSLSATNRVSRRRSQLSSGSAWCKTSHMGSKSNKQLLVDEIAAILEIERDELGNGSKEHLWFLQDIASALGLSPTGGKHEVARKIVEHLGGEWTRECYSRGDSVQRHCFQIIRDALGDRIGADQAEFMVAISHARACMQPSDPPPQGNRQPSRLEGRGLDFVRCPKVLAWILMHSAGVCEFCSEAAPFARADGTPYLELHHVRPLAEGGPDTVDNAVALCPTCHRAAHHARDRRDRRNQLADRLRIRGYGSPIRG